MKRILAAFLVSLLVLAPAVSQACRCRKPPEAKEALADSGAVFAGKVIAVEEVEGRKAVTLEVTTVWKGIAKAKVTIDTANNSAACGFGFEKGEAYLVYCPKLGEGEKKLNTNTCTRTKLLKEAKEDLEQIGAGMKLKAE